MRKHICVLTVMVMVQDPNTSHVLVQERISGGWEGITFPGGHVEKGETFIEAAIREFREETGLSVRDLIPCGVAQWIKADSDDRYITFLYKTGCYCGEIRPEKEGERLYFADPSELYKRPLSLNFDKILEVLLRDDACEACAEWLEDFSQPMRVL